MAEYIEREEAVRTALRAIVDVLDVHNTVQAIKIANRIREIPTSTDVVEVVRCKDCKYSTLMYGTYVCNNTQSPWFNDVFDIDLEANDFCSYGEREESDENEKI